jgi:hypothetical protein
MCGADLSDLDEEKAEDGDENQAQKGEEDKSEY